MAVQTYGWVTLTEAQDYFRTRFGSAWPETVYRGSLNTVSDAISGLEITIDSLTHEEESISFSISAPSLSQITVTYDGIDYNLYRNTWVEMTNGFRVKANWTAITSPPQVTAQGEYEVDNQYRAALVTAYNQLKGNRNFNFPEDASDNMKNAQLEQALFLIEAGTGMTKRLSLQAQGVVRAGIVEETYRNNNNFGIVISPYALNFLNTYIVKSSYVGIAEIKRNEFYRG